MYRIGRKEMFTKMAAIMSQRSTCNRARVGCIITLDNRIVCTGYNGAPAGMPHCIDIGCEIDKSGGCLRCLHAEAAAISFAARKGISLEGGDMYVTHLPCYSCAKLIINAGILHVYYVHDYRDERGLDLLCASKIGVTKLSEELIYGYL